MESLQSILKNWNKKHDSFSKLQHTYMGITITSFLVAGLISLINYSLGQSILFVAMCALLVFIANGVVWALVRTFLTPSQEKPQTTRKK